MRGWVESAPRNKGRTRKAYYSTVCATKGCKARRANGHWCETHSGGYGHYDGRAWHNLRESADTAADEGRVDQAVRLYKEVQRKRNNRGNGVVMVDGVPVVQKGGPRDGGRADGRVLFNSTDLADLDGRENNPNRDTARTRTHEEAARQYRGPNYLEWRGDMVPARMYNPETKKWETVKDYEGREVWYPQQATYEVKKERQPDGTIKKVRRPRRRYFN
jgi:hypothetical protein